MQSFHPEGIRTTRVARVTQGPYQRKNLEFTPSYVLANGTIRVVKTQGYCVVKGRLFASPSRAFAVRYRVLACQD